jgi:hypothetical protein
MTSRELARIRAFDPGYPTFLGIDDRLQRLLKWSYEILRIDSPKNKDEFWEEILVENGIKKSKSHAEKKGFVIVLDPRHGYSGDFVLKYLQVPEEIAIKMKVLECPLTK